MKNAEHRPQTCNETMLRDKLRVFVPRISPPKFPIMSEQINEDEDLCVFFAEQEYFLFGLISDKDETMLVTELAPLGALDNYLREKEVGAMYFVESYRLFCCSSLQGHCHFAPG